MKETEVRGQLEPADVGDFIESLVALKFKLQRMGGMEDVLFDHPNLELKSKGQKLRIRYYSDTATGELCWKGRKYFMHNKKSREEWQAETKDVISSYKILEKLGFIRQKVIVRKIQVYHRFKDGYSVTCRIEEFPKMPGLVLAEIEGTKSGIDWTMAKLGLTGSKQFGPYTLNSFLKKYEKGVQL